MYPQRPYVLIEVANTHGGDITYLNDLMERFALFQGAYGMKFQPLSPDTLATPDFSWYSVYQELFFTPEQWASILQKAHTTKEVWIDIFDVYGVQIVRENLSLIHGIKFQSSVLFNEEVISELSQIDLSHCSLILNIAAQPLETIEQRIESLKSRLQPKTIYLEIGFQAYPTELADSGLSKMKALQERFNFPLVFADHLEGSSTDSMVLPLLAWQQGASILEKHVMLSDRETKYDHFSSMTPGQFEALDQTLERYAAAAQAPFINPREEDYLAKTVMIPVLKTPKSAGDLIHPPSDIFYRRSGKEGLTLTEIQALQHQHQVLASDKSSLDTVTSDNFRPARIGAIVACRMKSSRLKSKAILPIGALTSVEFCLNRVLRFESLDAVILASSTTEEDAVLSQHTHDPSVAFFRGDPEDVMKRYIDVCDAHQLDVIVRITADMPFVDNAVFQHLLSAHFESGADYTVGEDAAIGVNLEIFNTACLKRIKQYFPSADYSEYMTWYFQNNPEYVRINRVALPEIFVRNYRLTLDYEEDLAMLNAVESALAPENPHYTLEDVIHFLDAHPEVAGMNSHLSLRYKTDQSLIDLLNDKTKIRP
ncbi:MAG: N-acetylneuraminate synthase family protein [Bacteroidetes bacterium]|nr:N-acetylneuraminate synthase family protein [Bacteroidota bacterium]MBM3424656.1 hypothetical protein [Bacteroidota bacterium]